MLSVKMTAEQKEKLEVSREVESAMMGICRVIRLTQGQSDSLRDSLFGIAYETGHDFKTTSEIALRFAQAIHKLYDTADKKPADELEIDRRAIEYGWKSDKSADSREGEMLFYKIRDGKLCSINIYDEIKIKPEVRAELLKTVAEIAPTTDDGLKEAYKKLLDAHFELLKKHIHPIAPQGVTESKQGNT